MKSKYLWMTPRPGSTDVQIFPTSCTQKLNYHLFACSKSNDSCQVPRVLENESFKLLMMASLDLFHRLHTITGCISEKWIVSRPLRHVIRHVERLHRTYAHISESLYHNPQNLNISDDRHRISIFANRIFEAVCDFSKGHLSIFVYHLQTHSQQPD